MTYRCYFYGFDGFMLERDVDGLEPRGTHYTYTLRRYVPDYDCNKMRTEDRTFKCVSAFMVNRNAIAYYEEMR